MSYIPKYILKRMIPKEGVRKVPEGVMIEVINVISPISIDEIPNDDLMNYVEVLIDGKLVDKEIVRKTKLIAQGKTYGVEDLKSLVGTTIPVGEKINILFPLDLAPGKEYDVTVTIKQNNPITINVQRELLE